MKFMKSICFVLCFILIFVLGGCDNNEGPFELRRENGTLILYSNDKPAKGWVVENNIDYTTGITIKSSEIEYNKGLPTGKFKFYNNNGILFWDADLKKHGELYKGNIDFYSHKGENLGKMEGTFIIDSDWIIDSNRNFDFLPLSENFDWVTDGNRNFDFLRMFENIAVDAKYDGNDAKGTYKNEMAEGEWLIFKNGNISEKFFMKEGELHGLYESFHSTGEVLVTGNFVNGEKNGLWSEKKYGVNNEIRKWSKAEYKNGLLDGKYESFDVSYSSKFYRKGTYKNGLKEGVFEYLDNETHKLYKKETYKAIPSANESILEGLWEKYDELGNLTETGEVKDNKLVGNWKYFKDGKIVMEKNYSTGEMKEFYDNGSIKFEVFADYNYKFYDEKGSCMDGYSYFSRLGVRNFVKPETVNLFKLEYWSRKLPGDTNILPWYGGGR